MAKRCDFHTRAEGETASLGLGLGRVLGPGSFVALVGGLGSGKTTLARGLLRGLGVPDGGASPTFTIVREYSGRLPVYHFDLYRIESPDALLNIGWDEYVESGGVCVVEWADRAPELWPRDFVHLTLAPGEGPNDRHISATAAGDRSSRALDDWMQSCAS